MPIVAGKIDLPAIAKACGFVYAFSVEDYGMPGRELAEAKERGFYVISV